MSGPRTTQRDPLCVEALRTNRELRDRVNVLERRLLGQVDRRSGGPSLGARLTEAETQIREMQESPWTYLPWRGYVS
jgi:hypothetical protein